MSPFLCLISWILLVCASRACVPRFLTLVTCPVLLEGTVGASCRVAWRIFRAATERARLVLVVLPSFLSPARLSLPRSFLLAVSSYTPRLWTGGSLSRCGGQGRAAVVVVADPGRVGPQALCMLLLLLLLRGILRGWRLCCCVSAGIGSGLGLFLGLPVRTGALEVCGLLACASI